MLRWLPSSRPGRWVASLVCAGIVFAALPQALAQAPHPEGWDRSEKPLFFVREVRALSPDQASSNLPVTLKGVVTVLSGWKNSFFLQDATSGISVNRLDQSPELHAGDEVMVSGTTAPGDFAPTVLARKVQIVGTARMPPAKLYRAADLLGGTEDSQWMSLHGNVRAVEVRPMWGRTVLLLTLDIGSDVLVKVHVHDFDPGAIPPLIGATVTIRGVCGTLFNDRRQFVGLLLFSSSLNDIAFERLPPLDPFDVPARPLGDLFQFSDAGKIVDQVKVTGIVTWSRARKGFYLQEGGRAAYIESSDPFQIRVGNRVDVVGYPISRHGQPSLHASFVRTVRAGPPVRPALHAAADMMGLHDGFLTTPYDAQLVTLQGRLMVSDASTRVLLLKDGNQSFSAILPNSSKPAVLEQGSLVQVTGICSVSLDETRDASSFQILMRSPADIKVLQRPPLWSDRRALRLLEALSMILIGLIVWSVIARRRADLKALIVTDSLTSLYNRRGFELLAHKQRQLAMRRRTDMLLFYLDINRFKQINDKFGHRQGDQALQHVALALQEAFRESDIIGRLGGDEFAVISIGAPPASEKQLLRRLDEELEKIHGAGDQPFRITISAGVVVCRYNEEERTLEDLLEHADRLMYAQKRTRADRSRSRSFIWSSASADRSAPGDAASTSA